MFGSCPLILDQIKWHHFGRKIVEPPEKLMSD